ncbi:alpha/beta fold hydrolase [Streptomyces sp. NPDC097107]|uniref:alpha/beta fold hydrolase n=1 Tax=Streptomyces sp. NPDC097107 TaxID=3366089 RepID=UPI00382FEBCF
MGEEAAAAYAEKFADDRDLFTGALNWYRALPLDAAYGMKAGVIRVPTLYVWGKGDRTVGEKAARMTGRWVAGEYDFQPLEGVTHWIPEQEPELIAEMILRHIEGVSSH